MFALSLSLWNFGFSIALAITYSVILGTFIAWMVNVPLYYLKRWTLLVFPLYGRFIWPNGQ